MANHVCLATWIAYTTSKYIAVQKVRWHFFCFSLTHCCAWPAKGRSVLHIERSWPAIQAAPTDRPVSSSNCSRPAKYNRGLITITVYTVYTTSVCAHAHQLSLIEKCISSRSEPALEEPYRSADTDRNRTSWNRIEVIVVPPYPSPSWKQATDASRLSK